MALSACRTARVVYEAFWFIHKSCSQGASTTIYACLLPGLQDHSGAYLIHATPRPTAGCDDAAADLLWRDSKAAAGLTDAEEAAVAK